MEKCLTSVKLQQFAPADNQVLQLSFNNFLNCTVFDMMSFTIL